MAAAEVAAAGAGEAVLATWRQLLDDGPLQHGDPYLAATARPPVARLSAATAAGVGVADGEPVTVATDAGAITLPLRSPRCPTASCGCPALSERLRGARRPWVGRVPARSYGSSAGGAA